MRRAIASGLAVIVVVGLVAGLSGGCGATSQAATNIYTEKDNGKTIDIKVGDEFDVVLAANPTTGYEWEMTGGDTSIVKLVGQPEYNATPTSTQVVGSGGTTTFHFQAVKAGQTTIELIYHRKFEQGVPPAQTMQLTAQVK